jgi:hypothetical protein
MTADTLTDRIQNIDGKNLGVSVLFAFIPAVGLAAELAIGVPIESGLLFWLPLAGFTYLLYHQHPTRNKAGSILYYLSIEFFLLPIAILTFWLMREGETSPTAMEQLAGGIAAGIFLVVAIIIGFCGGIALYLISKRVLVETPNETGASG